MDAVLCIHAVDDGAYCISRIQVNQRIGVTMDQDKAIVQVLPDAQNLELLSQHLLKSGLFPNAKSVQGVLAIIEYGRELGLPPVAALQTLCVINGKLAMEAKAMLAVAHKNAGVTWKIDKLNDTECAMTFMRPGAPPIQSSFTEAEAKEAGLLNKTSWKLYKQDMLFARCASRGVRRIAPDAVLGLYSTEEMRDVKEIESAGIEVPDDKELQVHRTVIVPATVPAEVAATTFTDVEPEPEPETFDGPVPIEQEQPEVKTDSSNEWPPTEEDVDLTDDSVLNSYIAQIKYAVERAGIDEKSWKDWLVGQGKKMNRLFVGRIGRALRYHKGKPDDVKYLQSVIDRAISLYVKETTHE